MVLRIANYTLLLWPWTTGLQLARIFRSGRGYRIPKAPKITQLETYYSDTPIQGRDAK